MEAKVIKAEAEYEAALKIVERYMDAQEGTPEADALELWSVLVEEYEKRAYPIDMPDPIAAIRFRMEQEGLEASDMQAYLGSKSKVSEVLSGKRPLSLSMIRKLERGLGIPAHVLIRETPSKRQSMPA